MPRIWLTMSEEDLVTIDRAAADRTAFIVAAKQAASRHLDRAAEDAEIEASMREDAMLMPDFGSYAG